MNPAPASPRLNTVLVGVGGFGRTWWPSLTAHSDRIHVVAVVDPDAQARDEAARHFRLAPHAVRDLLDAALLRDVGAELVVDSSPPPYRRAHALVSLAHGARLIAAKPLGWSLKSAEDIVRAGPTPESVTVVQQMRYFPCLRALRELLDEGRYGPVTSVSVEMALDSHGWAPGMEWRVGMDHPVFLEAAIHHLDLLRHCLGTELNVVGAAEWNPPWSPFPAGGAVAALLRTGDGVPVHYEATLAPRPGRALVRFDSGWQVTCRDATLTVVDGGLFVDGEPTGVPATAAPVPLHDLNDRLLTDWLAALDAGRPAPVNGRDNLVSMRLLDQVMRAAADGAQART
ncbi:Gfo/Idh/MocA family oxidoreductase [Streptomyces misionensis]|uniref:Gfo/Idh/MocA family oxidoreductase n=1 Tax=Streptomyces misionensis TaxID=67331 RepID=A0A5C6K2G2_9ACTN|nr:Gfo/Idh/MocA family oxidoreductase [Streptomyces misionensis]TWV57417.1 Gfo/Idh/MocA family oxidoreductase [Streptomyces misionensis]